MHYALDVCDQTGMLATAFCPSHSVRGVIGLPPGHPLYGFTETQYAGVLADYLGEYAAMRLTSDRNTNNMLLQGSACTFHQYGVPSYEQTFVDQQLLPDAQLLLARAREQLSNTPETQPGYWELQNAITNLVSVMTSNPSSDALAGAMGSLTQAMANALGSW